MAEASLALPVATAEQPVPPHTHRRPRVREVSSRFMTPLIHSNSTPSLNPSDFTRTKSVNRRLIPKTDENHAPDMNRGLEKLSASIASTVQRKSHHQLRSKQIVRENCESKDQIKVSSRPDTPIVDRIVPSRYRQVPSTISRSNSLNSSSSSLSTVTAAAKLLQEATADTGKKLSRISTSSRDDIDCGRDSISSSQGTSSCPNSPLCVASTKLRNARDTRSSMPDVEKWLVEKGLTSAVKTTSDCSRSLNFSSCPKNGGGITLPPHPCSYVRSGLDSKKGGRKGSSNQEDVHSLKMLQNHYMQWRFANVKSEASAHAQKQEAESQFYSIGTQISDLRDSVKRKRHELAVLRRIKTLTMIVDAQMPHLDEWAALEEEFSTYLSGTTDALLNSSVRLAVSGEVRADIGEVDEALTTALKVAKTITDNIQRFMTKAEEMDTSVSELAKTASEERALIEECGHVLSKTYVSQVKEWSLRGSAVQLGSNIV